MLIDRLQKLEWISLAMGNVWLQHTNSAINAQIALLFTSKIAVFGTWLQTNVLNTLMPLAMPGRP